MHIKDLIRKHCVRCSQNLDTSLIFGTHHSVNDDYAKSCLETKNVATKGFIYLDKNGYFEGANGILIFYHFFREPPRKALKYVSPLNALFSEPDVLAYNLVNRFPYFLIIVQKHC